MVGCVNDDGSSNDKQLFMVMQITMIMADQGYRRSMDA